jgi:hypothetical protein
MISDAVVYMMIDIIYICCEISFDTEIFLIASTIHADKSVPIGINENKLRLHYQLSFFGLPVAAPDASFLLLVGWFHKPHFTISFLKDCSGSMV